jgi:hypothetical protein
MNRLLPPIAALLSLFISSAPARADEPDVEPTRGSATGETMSLAVERDPRGRAGDWMIMPGGMYILSGGLSFVTAPVSPFADAADPDPELRFTDMVLANLAARYSIKGRAEIGGSIDLLPKQPADRSDWVWQRAALSGRVGFAKRFAGYGGVSGGPMFGGDGLWTAGDLGLEAQKSIHETLVFHGVAGGSLTSLFPESKMDGAWFAEAVVGGEMIFRAPNGMFAGWIGTGFHFPVAERARAGSLDLDPQTRANFSLGSVLSYIDDWDITFAIEVIDRGDVSQPDTTLPIIAGGFDQTRLVLGVTRRFKEESYKPMMLIGR